MKVEKTKEFFEMDKRNELSDVMKELVNYKYGDEDFAKLCEIGALASSSGRPGLGGARFFINLLTVQKSHGILLNLLKVFVRAESYKMVELLLEKGVNPFIALEDGKSIFEYVKNESMLNLIVEKCGELTKEQKNSVEMYRIILCVTA